MGRDSKKAPPPGQAAGAPDAAGEGPDRMAMARQQRARQRAVGAGNAEADAKVDDAKAGDAKADDAKAGDAKADDANAGDAAAPCPYPLNTSGIVAEDIKVADGQVPAGQPVYVAGGDDKTLHLVVTATGYAFDAPLAQFIEEPGVAAVEGTDYARDDAYGGIEGALWEEGGPKAADVSQGNIGDCYLIATLMALVEQNPGAIKKLFDPQTPNAKAYNVTMYSWVAESNSYTPVTVSVDCNFPMLAGTDTPAYEGNTASSENGVAKPGDAAKKPVLWPMLLEKAYAMAIPGGYYTEGQGGLPAAPMSLFTGLNPDMEEIDDKSKPDDTRAKLEQLKKSGEAVVVGTRGDIQAAETTPFKKGDDGSYAATLKASDGFCELDPGTVKVTDDASKHKSALADDGNKKMAGDNLESGSVEYMSGDVSLKFKADAGPDDAKNLKANYQYMGMISKELNLFGPHAYVFERIDGDNVILKNPWGFSDPVPIPLARFAEFFDLINAVKVGGDAAAAQAAPSPATAAK